MQSGDAANLHLQQYLRLFNPSLLFLLSTSCSFNWDACSHSKITKQEYLSRSNEYLSSNHVNHLISVCSYIYSQRDCMTCLAWYSCKTCTSHGMNGKATRFSLWAQLGTGLVCTSVTSSPEHRFVWQTKPFTYVNISRMGLGEEWRTFRRERRIIRRVVCSL